MQVLKDESKNNKVGRPEITGATRNRDPLCCACNGVATMLVLRYGRGGVIGQLPDFFDVWNDWPSRNSLFSKSDGEGVLPYTGSVSEPGHVQLFSDMKQAAGLLGIMSHTATKLRSFGAMHAHQKHASNPEIERMGRCVSCRYSRRRPRSPPAPPASQRRRGVMSVGREELGGDHLRRPGTAAAPRRAGRGGAPRAPSALFRARPPSPPPAPLRAPSPLPNAGEALRRT